MQAKSRIHDAQHVVEFVKTDDLIVSELRYVRVLEGTFVAQATSYEFTFAVGCEIFGPAYAGFPFYVGHATAGGAGASLYDAALAPTNGGSYFPMGVVQMEVSAGTSSRTVVKSGLTVGQTVTFQVMLSILGGSTSYKCIDAPNGIVVAAAGGKMFVSKYGSASIQPWRLNPAGLNTVYDFGWNEQPGRAIPCGAGPGRIVAGFFYGLVANFTASNVTTFDVINETFVRDTASPSGIPIGIFLIGAETTAYVVTTTGVMFPITVATGAAGSTVAVGAGTDVLYDVCLDATETKAYVANNTQNSVRVVTLPGTLGASIALGAGPIRIRRPPGKAVTGVAATDIITVAQGLDLKAGEKVVFSGLTGGSGLANGTNYYVIAANLTATTFQVSTTSGGSAVNFTTDITAGFVQRNKLWVLTEAGGPGGVAMMKSIDLDTETVSATYNCDWAGGNDFTVMTDGNISMVCFDGGKWQQVNLETEFPGERPTGHSANAGYIDDSGIAQLFTGTVAAIATDKLDSIYMALLEVDRISKLPGGQVRVLCSPGQGGWGNFCSLSARSV